jgi:3-phenylpropionate/trans-cinnamate dioxygenase ferredoxin subunit
MKWHKIEGPIPEQEFVMPIKVDGKKLCLVRHQQQLFVVQNTCPHAGGILSGGWCKNGYLICPIHRWEYNLQNGRGAEGQGDYVETYPVETRPDGIYVGIKESFWKKILG